MFREHGDIPGKTRRGEKYALWEFCPSKYPVSSKIAMAVRRKQWTGPGPRAAAGQQSALG